MSASVARRSNIFETHGYLETNDGRKDHRTAAPQQRAELDEKIKALTTEVKPDMKAFLKKGNHQ
jgi:hypothetical protein